jgi:hypothetical protein
VWTFRSLSYQTYIHQVGLDMVKLLDRHCRSQVILLAKTAIAYEQQFAQVDDLIGEHQRRYKRVERDQRGVRGRRAYRHPLQRL